MIGDVEDHWAVGRVSTEAVAHLRRLRGLLLELRDPADAMVAAIDRELEAQAKGLKVTPEEQLKMLEARLYDAIGGAIPRHGAPSRGSPRRSGMRWGRADGVERRGRDLSSTSGMPADISYRLLPV
ncbi:hypothetical protein ADK55_31305 [Streptomyces sp. WM4235]|nr:hypothetical protein ADK55_31305 [Streptomyces sp. WM4235]